MKPTPATLSPVALLGATSPFEKRPISLSGADESVSSFEVLLRATPGSRRSALTATAHAADNTQLSLTESAGELDLLGKATQSSASSRSSPGDGSDDESGQGLVLPEGVASPPLLFWPAYLGAAWGAAFQAPASGAGTTGGMVQTGLAQAGPVQMGLAPASLAVTALGTAHSLREQSNLAGSGLASPVAGLTEIPAGFVLIDPARETLPVLPAGHGSPLTLSAADQTPGRALADVLVKAFVADTPIVLRANSVPPGMPISRAANSSFDPVQPQTQPQPQLLAKPFAAALSSAAAPQLDLRAFSGLSEAAGPRLSVEPRSVGSASVVLAQHPAEHVDTWASPNLKVAEPRLQVTGANQVLVRTETGLVQTGLAQAGPAQMGLAQASLAVTALGTVHSLTEQSILPGSGLASSAAGLIVIAAGFVRMDSARETLPALPVLPVMPGSPLSLSLSEAAGPRLFVEPRSLDSAGVVLAQHPAEHVDTWASPNLKVAEPRLQVPGAIPVLVRTETGFAHAEPAQAGPVQVGPVQAGSVQMGLAQASLAATPLGTAHSLTEQSILAGSGLASPAAGPTAIAAGFVPMDSAREILPALPVLPVMPASPLTLSAADQTQSRAPAEVSARTFSPGMPISRAATSSSAPIQPQPQPLATPFAAAMSGTATPKPGLRALSGLSEASGPRLSVEPRSLDSAGVVLAQFGAVSVVQKPHPIEQNQAPSAVTEVQHIADARGAWVPELGGMVSPSEKFTGLVDFAQHLAEHVDTWVSQNLQVAELRLQEPSANPVLVRIEMNGQQASVMFRTDLLACREALTTQIDQLSDLLSAQGLQLAGASVAGSGADSQPGREARPSPVWGEPAASRSAPELSGVAQSPPRRGPALAGRTLDVFV